MPKSNLKQIEKLENEIRAKKEALAKLRHREPMVPVQDYLFKAGGSKSTKLSSLFGKKSELILVHNMGKSCPYCALWADGYNGMLKHLENRAAFAVESPDSPAIQKTVAKKRGWNFTFVSSEGSTFKKDMGFENSDGDPCPGVSTFYKDKKGKLFRASSAVFGPGDNYCSVWDFFDLLPKGANDWEAKFNY